MEVVIDDSGPLNFVSPRSLPYLSCNPFAYDLLGQVRWAGEARCPRCNSGLVRRVNNNVYRDLLACKGCNYSFNSLSNSIFQRSKLPVFRYLQFFVMHNAADGDISAKELCFALDVTYVTALKWQRKILSPLPRTKFAIINSEISQGLQKRTNPDDSGFSETFFSYCEFKNIVVSDSLFIKYIRELF